MKRNLFVIAGILALFGAGGAYLMLRGTTLPEHPLDRVPHDAGIAFHVDVPALMGSTLWKTFVVARGQDAGLRQLEERCGFDPVAAVENVTAYVMGGETPLEHVGFVVEGDFDHEALAGCLRSAVTEDGGALEEVEVEGARAVASGDARAAFIGRRGIIAGNEAVVGAGIRAVAGRDSAYGDDAELRALWNRLAEGREIVAVASVPEHWKAALERWLGTGRASSVTAHIDGLTSIGIGARVSRGFGLTVVATAASPDDATALSGKLYTALERFRGNPLLMFTPAGPLLRDLEAQAKGKEITLGLDITEERLGALLTFAKRVAGLSDGDVDAPPAPTTTAPAAAAPAAP